MSKVKTRTVGKLFAAIMLVVLYSLSLIGCGGGGNQADSEMFESSEKSSVTQQPQNSEKDVVGAVPDQLVGWYAVNPDPNATVNVRSFGGSTQDVIYKLPYSVPVKIESQSTHLIFDGGSDYQWYSVTMFVNNSYIYGYVREDVVVALDPAYLPHGYGVGGEFFEFYGLLDQYVGGEIVPFDTSNPYDEDYSDVEGYDEYYGPGYVWNHNSDNVNIRESPSTDSKIVYQLAPDDAMTCYGDFTTDDDGNTWFLVHNPNYEGWVRSDVVTFESLE
jgi:hypothetical protein